MTKIRDVMTPDVVAVTPSTTLMDAAKTMIEQEKGPLPVVEGDRPVGMITRPRPRCPCGGSGL